MLTRTELCKVEHMQMFRQFHGSLTVLVGPLQELYDHDEQGLGKPIMKRVMSFEDKSVLDIEVAYVDRQYGKRHWPSYQARIRR